MKYFKSKGHIKNLIELPYYLNLMQLRNVIEISCDDYFQKKGAVKVDLCLISKGTSSPMGKGSDSLSLPVRLGTKDLFLADSAQFGMEPLVLGRIDMAYCYLPSFRGEDNDARHMNQFYHCETEMKGDYKKAMSIAEGLIKCVVNRVVKACGNEEFEFKKHNFKRASLILDKQFPVITFDEAVGLLKNIPTCVVHKKYGRVLTNRGEIEISKIVGGDILPVWITKYDRDVVAFYQKPDPKNPDKVLNADLVFPSFNSSIGGEMLGLGQRQDDSDELKKSMERQEIKNIKSYSWYLELRKHHRYQKTAGFGLGIERFIAWLLGLSDIADASLLPVLKNVETEY